MCLHAGIVVMFLNTLIMIKTYMLIKKLSKRTFTKYLLHTGKLWSIANEGLIMKSLIGKLFIGCTLITAHATGCKNLLQFVLINVITSHLD